MQVAEIELLGAPAGGWPPGVDAGEDRIIILPNTTVQLPPVTGSYTLKLYATDVETEASDTMQIAVVESMCPVGNLNKDCVVNMADVLIMAENWLIDSGATGDINGKDGVNITDYSLLAANWREEGPSVAINEFVAINDSKYPLESGEVMDEDGDSSDWIELHNVTNLTISLKGWYLTNDVGDPPA